MSRIRCLLFPLRILRCDPKLSLCNAKRILPSTCVINLQHQFSNLTLQKCTLPFQDPFNTVTPHSGTTIRGFWSGKTSEAKDVSEQDSAVGDGEPPKLSLFQRYKKMMKEYWYVLIPVHLATSGIWFGSFFYAAKCGVDIVPFLEYIGLNESWVHPFRNSSIGHLAVASAMYKLATPARYTMTLGGTTLAIRVLTKRGLIKPIPSKEKMKEMVKAKRDNFIHRKASQQ